MTKHTGLQSLIRAVVQANDEAVYTEQLALDCLESALRTLSDREKDIIKRRHKFDASPDDKATLFTVAKDLGISPSRVTQIEKKAVAKLAEIFTREYRSITVRPAADNLVLADLKLNARTKRVLNTAGIHSVADICSKPPSFFLKFPGYGRDSLTVLELELAKYDLKLADETEN